MGGRGRGCLSCLRGCVIMSIDELNMMLIIRYVGIINVYNTGS